MKRNHEQTGFFRELSASVRITLATMGVCSILYTLAVLGIGQTLTPHTANGSLIQNSAGDVIGSRLIAQNFTRPEYFWPRPSAVNYGASASGGSNLSPANPEITKRATDIIAALGGSGKPIPADLVTASGSGLDPHITLAAARYQANRVAKARGIPVDTIMDLLEKNVYYPESGFTSEALVNVLLINLELDGRKK